MSTKEIKDRISKYQVSFLEGDSTYIITEPWIYFSVLIHAYIDSHKEISCNGFLEDDPNLLEDAKESDVIVLKDHVDKWLSEDQDVVSFRYKLKESKWH